MAGLSKADCPNADEGADDWPNAGFAVLPAAAAAPNADGVELVVAAAPKADGPVGVEPNADGLADWPNADCPNALPPLAGVEDCPNADCPNAEVGVLVCPKAGLGRLDWPNAGVGVLVWPKAGLAPKAEVVPPDDEPNAEVVPLALAPKADCPNADPLAGVVELAPKAPPDEGEAPNAEAGLLAEAPNADVPNADGVED